MFFEGTASSPYADDTIVYGVGEMGEEALTTPWLVAAPGEMLHVGDASVLPWYYAAYVNASSTGNSTASGARGTQAAVTWLSVPRPPYATSRAEWAVLLEWAATLIPGIPVTAPLLLTVHGGPW